MEGTVGNSRSSSSLVVKSQGERKLLKDRVKVKRKTIQTVLERASESLSKDPCVDDDGNDEWVKRGGEGFSDCADKEAEELCDLLRSRIDCPDFLETLEPAQMSVSQHAVVVDKVINYPDFFVITALTVHDSNSWDVVSKNDLWGSNVENRDVEEYVLVGQEDIVEGIACFMAAYLLSIKEAKDVTPNQLQEALRKIFSAKKKKSKLRKAWDGSKVIYDVASWGATAIGIYQNPVILKAAAAAFWTSVHLISKLL